MSLRSFTYVSRAVLPFSPDDFRQLGLESARLNALDGITGLLVFNGTGFCQTIEGFPEAIEDLVTRLRRDSRHEDMTAVGDVSIDARCFPSWDLQLLSVPEDREEAIALARARYSDPAHFAAREQIYRLIEHSFR